MNQIAGWLEVDEAELLIAATAQALRELPKPHTIVEIGSYCGRSTVAIGSVAKTVSPEAKLVAIDPHNGQLGAIDQHIQIMPSSLAKFQHNINQAGLSEVVELIQKHSFEVKWEKPISLLLIDGLHDYTNVARDFYHFEHWVVPGGYVAFHDYADYYPGVKALVNEVLNTAQYQKVDCVRSMMIIQKQTTANEQFPR